MRPPCRWGCQASEGARQTRLPGDRQVGTPSNADKQHLGWVVKLINLSLSNNFDHFDFLTNFERLALLIIGFDRVSLQWSITIIRRKWEIVKYLGELISYLYRFFTTLLKTFSLTIISTNNLIFFYHGYTTRKKVQNSSHKTNLEFINMLKIRYNEQVWNL